MPDLIGQTVGKYRIVARLGRGGMAEVYKAYQPGLDRYVAIKVLHSYLAEDPDFIGRFEREARAVANLRHPNIVQVFDFDVQDNLYYMAMEFVDGPTLKAELYERSQQGQLFSLEETTRVMVALCEAIDYAHQHGMVHRDLKPANFILNKEGQVLILDFGIAKIVGATQYTLTGALSGTPTYMSPEQGQGERGDARSDIYSLGVVLYEMATGRVPFDADTPFAVIMKHISDPLPLPRSINPNLPEPVERVILKALSKNPDDRFQSGTEFASALRNAVGLSAQDTLIKNPVTTIAPTPKVQELLPTDGSFTPLPPRSNTPPPGSASANAVQQGTPAVTLTPQHRTTASPLLVWGGIATAGLIILVLAILLFVSLQRGTENPASTTVAITREHLAETATAQALALQSEPTATPVPPTATTAPAPTATPTVTPNLESTIQARLTATAIEYAVETAESVGTKAASKPTNTPVPPATSTPTATSTPVPTNTPPPPTPRPTRVPATPTPAPPPTPAAPKLSGKIAVPIMNWGTGHYDVSVYDIATGKPVTKLPNARQPTFRGDGAKLLVNGDGGGRDNVWEVDAASGNFDKAVSGSPTDSHPFYNPQGDRLVYDNPNLAIGADGNNHPYLFVQCGLRPPQEETDQKCHDVAVFDILVPAGQIGEIFGASPVWTGDDRIAYRGCNTWSGGNSCGVYIVGSWANKKNSNGETPAKLPGIDGTSATPTDAQGNLILYHARETGDWEVFLSTVGGGPVNLTNAPASNEGLGTFSPDGKSVAFVSDRSGAWAVWAVPAAGGNAVKLFDLPPNSWGSGEYDWTNERISWGP